MRLSGARSCSRVAPPLSPGDRGFGCPRRGPAASAFVAACDSPTALRTRLLEGSDRSLLVVMFLVGRSFPAPPDTVCLSAEASFPVDRDLSSPLDGPGLGSAGSLLRPLLMIVRVRCTLVEVESSFLPGAAGFVSRMYPHQLLSRHFWPSLVCGVWSCAEPIDPVVAPDSCVRVNGPLLMRDLPSGENMPERL